MGRKFKPKECGCKFLDYTNEDGESVIVCNEWDNPHHCSECGFNPKIAKQRLMQRFRCTKVKEALEVSKNMSIYKNGYNEV